MEMETTQTEPQIAVPNQASINWLNVLRKRYWLLVIGLSVGIVGGMLHYYSSPIVYQSQMEVLVGERSTELTRTGTASSSDVEGSTAKSSLLATHIRLLTSTLLLTEAHKQINPDAHAMVFCLLPDPNAFVSRVRSGLSVVRGGDKNLEASTIRLIMRDSNPKIAKESLDLIYLAYREHVSGRSQDTGAEAIKILTKAQEQHETELRQAETEYQEFVRSAQVLLVGDEIFSRDHNHLRSLETELASTDTSIHDLQQRLAQVEHYLATPPDEANKLDHLLVMHKDSERLQLFLQAAGSIDGSTQKSMEQQVVEEEYKKLISLSLRAEVLAKEFGPDHPVLQTVQEQIAVAKNFIRDQRSDEVEPLSPSLSPQEMVTAYRSLLLSDLEQLTLRKDEIDAELPDLSAKVKELEGVRLQFSSLQGKMERASERYEDVSHRLQELNLTASTLGVSTDVLEPAFLPQFPIEPNLFRMLMMGIGLGSMVGIGLAYLAETLDQTFRDPDDLQQTLRAPLLAHIPRFRLTTQSKSLAQQLKVSPMLRAMIAPRSIESEIFRLLRTSVLQWIKREHGKVIAVTSAHPGDGKSTVIGNLAVSMAQAGQKVLLIDADMRRPKVATAFGIAESPGLTDCLDGDLDLDGAVVQSCQDRLSLLPSGSPHAQPAELLESFRFQALLDQCREKFDVILLDSPPLLAVADPVILSQVTDGMVLAVRVQKNGRQSVERARAMIDEEHTRIIGVVVNGVSSQDQQFGYGYRGKSYTYGYVHKYQRRYASPASSPVTTSNSELPAATKI